MKTMIPAILRLWLRWVIRKCRDVVSGTHRQLARTATHLEELPFAISLTQPFLPGEYLANKIHNIQLAAQPIMRTTIYPRQIFSFWEIIGKPDEKKGYKAGRNLKNGVLQADIGGGLCQLSGILYHVSLRAGLEVLERYNHTVDIYTDDTRFSPLGADATVVFAYKDLRIRNPYPFPIRFSIDISPDTLICTLRSAAVITPQEIIFEVVEHTQHKEVKTIAYHHQQPLVLALSSYVK